MAIVKFINGKNEKVAGLIKCIDYVVDKNKTEVFSFSDIDKKDIPEEQAYKESLLVEKLISEDKVDRAIKYITKDGKTSKRLITGINCSPESAFDEMMVTKNMYNKTGGRQFAHFVHSYSDEENITPELAHEISLKLLEEERFIGFEVLVATHTDKGHLHTHFILNAVNSETGRKWRQSPKQLEELKESSNKLCHDYGLRYSFANIKTDNFMDRKKYSSGEYRAKKEGRSWKTEAFYAIDDCRKTSISKEDFIKKLDALGYKIRWEDSRKNITFTLPNGRKLNNDKLHPAKNFTKEALIKRFELNSQYKDIAKKYNPEKQFNEREELILQTVKMLDSNPNEGHKEYPRSYLENNKQSIKELMAEKAKGNGLDWDKEKER